MTFFVIIDTGTEADYKLSSGRRQHTSAWQYCTGRQSADLSRLAFAAQVLAHGRLRGGCKSLKRSGLLSCKKPPFLWSGTSQMVGCLSSLPLVR